MTLRLGEDKSVGAVPMQTVIQKRPENVALLSSDRKAGVLLRSISSPGHERRKGRLRKRLISGRSAA